jgi:ectoine hydroxylase-related dioxygenase (phytanoyl-CoA dioxygenase family)
VTEEMGAMQFVPGSHLEGLRHHRHVDDDPVLNLLVADGVDRSRAVACPLPAGGATFHHRRTLHHTAENTTDRPRLAFPTEFQTAPRRVAEPEHRSWVEAHRTATGRPPPAGYLADGRFVPA